MAEFSGSAVVCSWIWSGGTVTLQGDYRTCKITPSVNLLDGTAGSDARTVRYADRKDAVATIQLVAQTGGTALLAALAEGVSGTLIVGPEGTAANKPKTTISAISGGAVQTLVYNDISIIDCDFTGDGTTYTQGNY